LPAPTLTQLEQQLGRPPTIEEINSQEVALRSSGQRSSGSILERSSFDASGENMESTDNAQSTVPLMQDGQKPQAQSTIQKIQPPEKDQQAIQLSKPTALLRITPQNHSKASLVRQTGHKSVTDFIAAEREEAEVGVAVPIAKGK
jgi:hypothetical protein